MRVYIPGWHLRKPASQLWTGGGNAVSVEIFFFFASNQVSVGGTAVRPAVRLRTGVALEEAGEPVVAGAAVAVRTVVAVVEP